MPGYRVGRIAGGRWHDAIVRLKYGLAANLELYRDALVAALPEGTRVSMPRGGFVLWVELPSFVRISAGSPWSERVAQAIATLGRLVAVSGERPRYS